MVTTVSRHRNKSLEDALLERLGNITEGQIAATARRGGMPERRLRGLREGKSLDVKISTFVRLAQGLEVDPAALLAEMLGGARAAVTPVAPAKAQRKKAIAKVRQRLERAAAGALETAAALREVLRELMEE